MKRNTKIIKNKNILNILNIFKRELLLEFYNVVLFKML